MTLFQIGIVLLIGIIMLTFGLKKNKKWLIYISIIPLALVLWQFVIMLSI